MSDFVCFRYAKRAPGRGLGGLLDPDMSCIETGQFYVAIVD